MSANSITPNLMVEDVEATVEWYQQVFDAKVVATMPTESEPDHWWAQVSIDGTDIMFQARESLTEKLPALQDESIGGSLALYVDINDARAMHDNLDAAGVDVAKPPSVTDFGWCQFAVKDYNGYLLWFGEKVEEQGKDIGRRHRTYPDYLTDESEHPEGISGTVDKSPESWG